MNDVFYSMVIDKESSAPLYQQLGDAICELIEKGALKPNSKLPPIRHMASGLKINNATVVSAYKYLENKKVVYSQVGSGTYVSPIPIGKVPQPVFVGEHIEPEEYIRSPEKSINFANTSLPYTLFPVEEFKKSFNELLEREGGMAFSYQDSMGYEPLRSSICSYLEDYGIKTAMENIQIVSGAQQGIDIISKAMINYGDVIFVEKPTFYGAVGSFLSRGCTIIEVPMQKDGMDVYELEKLMKLYRPRFIYIMAYFQTPTGISYSMEKKRRILELADKFDAYILEDDNMYDFNYTSHTVVPIKALDYKGRVIYIKSFSKVLMPGLRIGFALLPKKIRHSVMQAKYTTDISTSGFIQKAIDIYMKKGSYKSHIDMLREYGRQRYNHTLKSIDMYLKDFASYRPPGGGISIWLKLKDDRDSQKLCSSLAQNGVIVTPGSQFKPNGEKSRHIRLCFGSLTNDEIDVGIIRIKNQLCKGL